MKDGLHALHDPKQNCIDFECSAYVICCTLINHSLAHMFTRLSRVMSEIMTVLLKNLFTVHFQFDLLKLETNNTRDDKLKHAWIIVR